MENIKQKSRGKNIIQAGRDIDNASIIVHEHVKYVNISHDSFGLQLFKIIIVAFFLTGTVLLCLLPGDTSLYSRVTCAIALILYALSILTAYERDQYFAKLQKRDILVSTSQL